ncbi:MAG: hypothetical protein ACE5R4_13600 [Armatimonadota bacterium]
MITADSAARLKRACIVLIGAHSLALGFAMLFWPRHTLELFRWPPVDNLFFPSQSGIFLMILGAAYLAALWHDDLVWLILASKTAAVLFLFGHVVLAGAPVQVMLAGIGDAGFGLLMGGLVLMEHRATAIAAAGESAPAAGQRSAD